tara:strand:- start:1815 stop:2021 length:207 start_codon:yes stop_codon:yes gene_type:complete
MIRLNSIYKAIAEELAVTGDESKEAIVGAVTSYCLALKAAGKAVPLWTEAGACSNVHRILEGVKHPEE